MTAIALAGLVMTGAGGATVSKEFESPVWLAPSFAVRRMPVATAPALTFPVKTPLMKVTLAGVTGTGVEPPGKGSVSPVFCTPRDAAPRAQSLSLF